MRFTKMHGCGNDYVFVDCFDQPEPLDPSSLSQRISNRQYGVGSDGLILILPSQIADARMRMFNSDGSEGAMCGNGIRCVAKYLSDRNRVSRLAIRIETQGDLHTITKSENDYCVDMGEPVLRAADIPTTLPGESIINEHSPYWPDARELVDLLHDTARGDFKITCVSMGNPHCVLFCKHVANVPLETVGPIIENAPYFPDRVNVHFAQVITPDEISMRTWERGSGITLACGTGACAVAVAGVLNKRTNRKVLIHLPGGDLRLDWSEIDNHVYMTGPAVEVYSGEWLD